MKDYGSMKGKETTTQENRPREAPGMGFARIYTAKSRVTGHR